MNALDFIERPTLLVVDDTPDNLVLMSKLLMDTYEVKIANSGERALSIAASATPPDNLSALWRARDRPSGCRRCRRPSRGCSCRCTNTAPT